MLGHAVLIGLWAYLFTHELTDDKEIFAALGRAVNRICFGHDFNQGPDELSGLRLILWKYTYCEKCHAGVLGALYGAFVYGSMYRAAANAIIAMTAALAAVRWIKP